MKKILITACLGFALVTLVGCGKEKSATQEDGLKHAPKTKCQAGKCGEGKCGNGTAAS